MSKQKIPVLFVDNFDSFSYNIIQLLEENGADIQIVTSNLSSFSVSSHISHILFSPGAGLPSEYPLMEYLLRNYFTTKKILGICLGHQAIAQFFNQNLYRQKLVQHGQKKKIIKSKNIPSQSMLYSLPQEFYVGLYHSWAVNLHLTPSNLIPSCYSEDSVIMGFHHAQFPIEGIQFHPESYMTEFGSIMINQWLNSKL